MAEGENEAEVGGATTTKHPECSELPAETVFSSGGVSGQVFLWVEEAWVLPGGFVGVLQNALEARVFTGFWRLALFDEKVFRNPEAQNWHEHTWANDKNTCDSHESWLRRNKYCCGRCQEYEHVPKSYLRISKCSMWGLSCAVEGFFF